MLASNLIQDTLVDNQQIFDRIKYELDQAKSEVLVAMAWFTDKELYDALVAKLADGVRISLIIADQPDNDKLNFDALVSLGASVIKIKNVGYGMMHQKFCIIDRKIAITGSYNWSINARNNNHENVIVTNYQKTIDELVTTFENIKDRARRIANGEILQDIIKDEQQNDVKVSVVKEEKKRSFFEKSLIEFRVVLDNIIATEVGSFDKEILKSNAYNRGKENSGDHQVLDQAMDSLYSNFINEIDVIAEKKTRLKAKIEEQQKNCIAIAGFNVENEITTFKEKSILETGNLNDNVSLLEKEINAAELQIKSNTETKIPFILEKIAYLKKTIADLGIEFVKPALNKPMLYCSLFFALALIAYIVVFYSSVAYILIFSKEEIQAELQRGNPIIETPEVFNPNAIGDIFSKGAGGVAFLFLFVIIPLTLGLYKLFSSPLDPYDSLINNTKKNWFAQFFNKYGGIILIVIVDVFIAYKVTKNINEIEYLTRKISKRASVLELLITENFFLVFILGSLGIFLLSIVADKIFAIYNQQSSTFAQQKTRFLVKQYENDIQEKFEEINEIKVECDVLESKLVNLKSAKSDLNKKLQEAPIELSDRISLLNQQFISYKERIASISNIFQSQVDNDKLPISKTELENRINIFMEGWSKYLYDTYAVQIAEKKTREAIIEIEMWLNKLKPIKGSSIDLMDLSAVN